MFAKETVNVKVHKSSDPEAVRTGKKFSVADLSSTGKVTLGRTNRINFKGRILSTGKFYCEGVGRCEVSFNGRVI